VRDDHTEISDHFDCLTAAAVRSATIPIVRLQYLARRIHSLGERPLAQLLIELAAGDDLHGVLERYARLAPLADFIRALDGERLKGPRSVSGRRP
jgi:hypothetical protein